MRNNEYTFPDGTVIYCTSALIAFCIYNTNRYNEAKPTFTFLEILDEYGRVHKVKISKEIV